MPLELMQLYSETAEGVHLHEAVPGWMLLCHRHWNRHVPLALLAERLEALSPAKPHSDAHAGASKLQAAYRGKTVRAKAKQPPDDAAKVATFVRAAIRGSFAQLVARGG